MTDRCFSIEELAEVAACDATDPRNAHLEQCPRCRARLASFQSFVDQDRELAGSRAEAASKKLARALEEEIFSGELPELAGGPTNPFRRFLGVIFAPQVRPAWAVLSIALLVIVIRQSWQVPPTEAPNIVLRGATPEATATISAQLELLAGGEGIITWSGTPEAERYVLILYGADLGEIRRLDCDSPTTFRLMPSDGPAGDDQAAIRFWRVVGMRGDEEAGRSALMTYPPN